MTLKKFLDIPPSITCPHCNRGMPVVSEFGIAYFYGKQVSCPECDKSIDWWDAILRAIKQKFFLSQILAPVGARSSVFEIILQYKKNFKLKFSDYAVPEDARILEIGYAPYAEGGLFPLEWHSNIPVRHTIPHEVVLYPARSANRDPVDTKVVVSVTWVPQTKDEESWQNLVDSFESYTQERFNSCIVPACVAVESKLSRLLTSFLNDFASKEYVEDFLEKGATYSHQLNVVLPVVATQFKMPKLPDPIRGLLNRLR